MACSECVWAERQINCLRTWTFLKMRKVSVIAGTVCRLFPSSERRASEPLARLSSVHEMQGRSTTCFSALPAHPPAPRTWAGLTMCLPTPVRSAPACGGVPRA